MMLISNKALLLECVLLFLLPSTCLCGTSGEGNTPNVCIIGSGITAASASYFLTAHSPSPRIIVFEQSEDPGGRIASLHIDEVPHPIEAGASIIASSNKLMRHFTDVLNLTIETPSDDNGTGLWGGSRFLFQIPANKLAAIFQVVFRYHVSLFRSQRLVTQTLHAYDQLYPKEGAGAVWPAESSVKDLFKRTGILFNLSQKHFLDVASNLSPRYLKELAAAIMRCNYGQDPSLMNGASGLVALAGSGESLWHVKGGNVQVVRGLLSRDGVDLKLNTEIKTVTIDDEAKRGRYILHSRDDQVWRCDAVIMAAPIELTNIDVPSTFRERMDVGRKFQLTVTTFVRGELNNKTFGESPPYNIFTTAEVKDVFTALARVWDGGKNSLSIFKLFSTESLTSEALQRIFAPGAKVIAEYPWFAYPKFNAPEKFGDFDVDREENGAFIYTSPLESAGSAMEMSAVSGANAAFLVRKKLGLVVEPHSNSKLEKEEL